MPNDKVARLRQLMSEAIPVHHEQRTAADERIRVVMHYDYCSADPLDQTPRARAVRAIKRIGAWYGLSTEIGRALDAARASTLQELGDDEIDTLLEQMQQLEQCIQHGLGSPYAPAAR